MIKSIENAEHYSWGHDNDSWHLCKSPGLSVIQEKMPPGNYDTMHFHKKSRQVFYILRGTAVFDVDGEEYIATAGQSIHISPGMVHRIRNASEEEIEFLVISSPPSHGDRVNTAE
ncbi:MAG: cupin domain-containing protein [Bacteroidia bacterium]|nr:cupin domain-containing protein [Bacteroidia bacterium]